MPYREPDISFSVPVLDRYSDLRQPIGWRIRNSLLFDGMRQSGILLSENGVETLLQAQVGGEAVYHAGGNTALVRVAPDSRLSPNEYGMEIFVEGDGKSELVKELEAQLEHYFRINAITKKH